MKSSETLELERALGIAEPEAQEVPEITKYEDAEQAMEVYAAASDRILERTAYVKARVELVMQRLEQLNAEDEKKKKYVSELLRGWGEQFVKKTKQKTMKFIRGQMSFKDVPEAVVVDNADTVAKEILARREDAEFTGKYGTIPLKIEIKFIEPEDATKAEVIRKATEAFVNTLENAKMKMDVGQREVAAFYKKSGIILEGYHVRPRLENSSFKIEAISLEDAGAEGALQTNGG